jgi:hypothetical protein
MRSFFTLVLFVCLNTFSFAQVNLVIAQTEYTVPSTQEEQVAKHVIENNGPNPINITWERLVECKKNGWTVFVCDNNTCWSPSVVTKTVDVASMDTTYLDLHVKPNGIEGFAAVRMRIFQTNDATNSDEKLILFNTCLTGTDGELLPSSISLYPNPSSSVFNVKGMPDYLSDIKVSDMSGRLLMQLTANNNTPFDISALPAGQYNVQFYDAQGVLYGALPLVKK